MKTPVKFGFFFALIFIIITMIFYLAGISKEAFNVGIMINIFLLLCTLAVGLFMTKKEDGYQKGIFIQDFKSAMQSGIIYALTIAGFMFLYHAEIDPSIRQELINKQVEAIHNTVPDAETYATLQDGDPTWQDKSYDDYIENMEDQITSMISPTAVFVAHLMGLTFFALLFGFFVTLIMRKVVLRDQLQ
ncbi:MAG: hypothetical protein ACI857_002361 [Arenicella sp.]|jgi:hypothetical protein